MRTLLYVSLDRSHSGRHQNFVRVGELARPKSIERIVELNLSRAAPRLPLSHVGGRRQETPQAPG